MQIKSHKNSSILLIFTIILAFIVIVLGAYTRLTDAGLGCPDWPGCYNQLIAPTNQQSIKKADQLYPTMPVHVTKAWTEMIHRYLAGTLGILIFILVILAIWRRRRNPGIAVMLPVFLLFFVVFQALLGKWTVTMKLLPVVVMGHLLGGFAILSLLWWYILRERNHAYSYFLISKGNPAKNFRFWSVLGLLMVVGQIALGGWTSANYAALVCDHFPFCNKQGFFPYHDFSNAFAVWNIHQSHLTHAALITIQMTHRIGAMVTAIYVGIISFILIFNKKKLPGFRHLGMAMLVLLLIQLSLGVLNIKLWLPLWVALLHNAVAALLLLSMVTFLYASFRGLKKYV